MLFGGREFVVAYGYKEQVAQQCDVWREEDVILVYRRKVWIASVPISFILTNS